MPSAVRALFVLLSVAGAYGGLAQLLAGMWSVAERDDFAVAVFSSYRAFSDPVRARGDFGWLVSTRKDQRRKTGALARR